MAFTNSWPLQAPPQREVRSDVANDPRPSRAGLQAVSAGYFDLLGIPIRDGRPFGRSDVVASPRVAVISETLATRVWPGESAVGRRLRVLPPANAPPGTLPGDFEVIGVVADTRHSHTDTDTADIFVALSQYGTASPFVYLRTGGDPTAAHGAFRTAVTRIDSGVVTGSLRPLADILDQQRAGSRFLAQLLGVFAGMATLLALIGLHGVIAYAAGQRRREIAIRLAVGASRGSIAAMFLRQGAILVAIGIVAGVAGALALGGLLESQLFGVRANDPTVIALTATAFGVCAFAASVVPARRAAGADPAEALKGE